MNETRAKEFRKELERRLDIALSWYKDCIKCDETLQNARRDVNSVFKFVCKQYDITNSPVMLRTRFSDDNYIVVDYIDRNIN